MMATPSRSRNAALRPAFCWLRMVHLWLLLLVLLGNIASAAVNDDSDLVFDEADDRLNGLDAKAGLSSVGGFVSPVETPQLQDDRRWLGRQQQLLDDDDDYDGLDGSGSGTRPPEIEETTPKTQRPTLKPEVPTSPPDVTSITPIPDQTPKHAYFRMEVVLTNHQYETSMSDRDSNVFKKLASELQTVFDSLFYSVLGSQTITVIKFEDHPPAGIRATIDLLSSGNDDETVLKRVIEEELEKRRIGAYSVTTDGFQFRRLQHTPPKCDYEEDFTCANGDCIPLNKYCDGTLDCDDGSDEGSQCDPECREGEFACDRKCLPNTVLCNKVQDCSNGIDEQNCPEGCPGEQFRCGNGQCIPEHRRCDYTVDCDDGTDESFCPSFPCDSRSFQCRDGSCVSLTKRCDGVYDCADTSDEYNCWNQTTQTPLIDPRPHLCSIEEWQCDYGDCIDRRRRCDGHRDCPGDNSDEEGCPAVECSSNQFRCGDGSCIDLNYKCDRRQDCPDNSDEHDCQECSPDQFMCSDGTCIRSEAQCDGNRDCPDGSDENCGIVCRDHEFRCHDQIICIDKRRVCDDYPDCYDSSDESNCPEPVTQPPARCKPTDFVCDNQNLCIDPNLKCNRQYDCQDGTDELICDKCGQYQHVCNDGFTCISWRQKCDGRRDCPSGEDEVGCQDTCAPSEARCMMEGACIPRENDCNGWPDCPDFSDEEECADCPNAFRCISSGKCLDTRLRCDGRPDCSDGSDEHNCDQQKCGPGEFQCLDKSCIRAQLQCDGRRFDCPDDSDENNCVDSCKDNEFQCHDKSCIPKSDRCNEYPHCPDRSDEENCVTCAHGYVSCNDGRCIDVRRKCDGRQDCRDGSDEICECLPGQFQCNDRICIDPHLQCDGKPDCYDGFDETNCGSREQCHAYQFTCQNGNCIDGQRKCDGHLDCADGSDEDGCPQDCSPEQFRCDDGSCIDRLLACNNRSDCSRGEDERDCQGCLRHEFRCRDGSCIDNSQRCDQYPNCPDHSDEQDCPTQPCSRNQFRCNNGECVHGNAKCDGRPDCRDGSDETKCPRNGCLPGQFVCDNNHQCIESAEKCDGKPDCDDYSDEKSCPHRGSVNLKTYPEQQTIHQSREVVFQCRDEGDQRAPVLWSRERNLPMPLGSTDLVGRLTMPNIQPEHSGQYFCSAIGFPHTQPGAQRSVTLHVTEYSTAPPPKEICGPDESTCHDGKCIKPEFVCDDDYDCQDGTDELNCAKDKICEPNEFRCNNSKCILKFWLCDGDNDCMDNSDEVSCTTAPPGSGCRYDEYQCRTMKQCIPKSFQCDGEMDCLDQSDEIGCAPPTIVSLPPEIVRVSVGETVTLTCRAIGNPTPLINWRLNWGNIPPPPRVTTTSLNGRGELVIRNVQPSDQGAYTCEAISNKANILGRPDTQLIVITGPPSSICRPPLFNSAARAPHECSRCFCFGATDQCSSGNMYTSMLPPIKEASISAVSIGPDGTYNIQDPRFAIDQGNVDFRPGNGEFRIDNRIRQGVPRSAQYYWTMPIQLQGDQLSSYGGYLRYSVMYRISSSPRPISANDVILKGNGMTIGFTTDDPMNPGVVNKIEAKFTEGSWIRLNTPEHPQRPGAVAPASREDIMMVLQNIEIFLVRAGYDENFSETSLIGLNMETAVPHETGQPKATLVEECACPPGYTGMSCQTCAPGYSRVATGRYLGECRRAVCNCHGHSNSCSPQGICERCQHNTEGPQCDQCQPGYYGDARRGTPNDCQPCPCPLTSPPNQFSSTCYLDRDGQITCDNCAAGYEGRRCDRCSPGYQGDPFIPGDTCRREPSDQCDALGSTSLSPNPVTKLCQCKAFVTGPRCKQCQASTFHLNPHSPGGCIPCFCMGITRDCSSCGKYRSSEKAQFTDSPQGFTITTVERGQNIERGLRADSSNRQLTFSEFYLLPRGRTYYWNLPSRFIGDKITSYGGYLNFTIEFQSAPGASPNSDADVLIIGNRITFDYYHRQQIVPNAPNTISIPLFEQYWKRTDGQTATREHLLMALADLVAILIKATYTTDTTQSSLSEVILETAVDHDTGLRRAVEVEQCRCPTGYKGLSCEDCDSGYTRSGSGLYLGLCETCFCNGHSSDCDPEGGRCKNCQHNTEGDFCEACRPGYKGDATQGTPQDCQLGDEEPCRCNIQGSMELDCDSRNQCPCKNNVQGKNCNRCKEGTFNLEARKPEGCTKCFCFGATDQCSSSSYYRSEVALQVSDPRTHGVILTNSKMDRVVSGTISGNVDRNEVMFRNFPSTNGDVETLYWSLPEQFIGNKLASYGGFLRFMQRYISRRDGVAYDDADIIIIGNGITLQYVIRPALQPDEGRNSEIELVETHWLKADPQGLSQAIRENFMMALANVKAILIRATFNSRMVDSVLGGVTLDTGVPFSTGKDLAYAVEQCVCPPGYTGLSCEECAPGYNRDPNAGPYLGLCTICNCHGHSTECDPNTGECLRCEHNTVGTDCKKCAQGYYGDATRGTPQDCQPCPCPLTSLSNQFSPTCQLANDGRPTCTACPAGYTGRNCENCAPGYRGNPRQIGDSCTPEDASISVRIEEPTVVRTQPGTTVTFRCRGSSQVRDVSYNIVWTKKGGRLPSQAQDRDGILTIPNCRQQDEGIYICTISDLYEEHKAEATLYVIGDEVRQDPPRMSLEPSYLDLLVGESAEIRCIAEGHPTPSIQWTREQGRELNPSSTIYDGVLRISSIRKADEGEYYCTATNAAGSNSIRTIIYVRGEDRPQPPDPSPRVSISPQSHTAHLRETVQFECRSQFTSTSNSYVSWSRSSGPLPSSAVQVGNTLTLPDVDESFQGVYICTVSSSIGSGQAQARLDIYAAPRPSHPPTCSIDPERQTASQGTTVEFRCSVSGEPHPSVRWSMLGGELGPHTQVIGTTLRINNVSVKDRGIYVCLAENAGGSAQASAILEFERREPPGIEMYPGTTQTIPRGGSALFQCRTTAGIPSPTITWTRADGRPLARSAEVLTGGSVIRFTRVVGDEAGQYVCTAENDAGVVTSTVTLTIEGLPIVKLSPASPYTASLNQRVHVECRAEGDPTPSVSWRQPSHHRNVGGISLPRESLGIAIMEINQVQQADAGTYVCSARNSAGVAEERFELNVEGSAIGNPGVETDRPVFKVPVGSRADLNCYTLGTEPLTFNWVRSDGRPLPTGHVVKDGWLNIYNVRHEDAGEYTCLGMEDGVVVFSAKETLQVIAPPRITLSPMRQTARPGDTVTVQCTAQGDDPINIEWTRVGSNLGPRAFVRGGTLQFHGISMEDAGRYLCKASNPAGEVSGVAEVIVNDGGGRHIAGCVSHESICNAAGECREIELPCTEPFERCDDPNIPCTSAREGPAIHMPKREIIVYVGAAVDLPCEVRGSPQPTVMWSKEFGDLPVTSHMIDTNLKINSVRIEDAGRYFCKAVSNAGSSEDYLILHVKGLTPVTVHIRPSLDAVRMGDSLDVHCDVSGDPSALISWSRVGESLPYNVQTAGNLLRVTNVTPQNGGVYRCQVDTFTGIFTDDYVLAIQDIPSLPQHRKVETRTAPFGSTISMDCRSTLHPPVEYVWTKQGGLLPADATVRKATLTIPDVRAEDAGTYVCSARDSEDSIDIPTVLIVTGVVPYFAQAPSSFMALPSLPDVYLNFDIEISFRPESPDGLILYNGQESGGRGDFVSFGLNQGYAEFRFDVGSGPAVIRSESPLAIREWHTVQFKREKREGMMMVIGQDPINGTSIGKNQGLDLVEPLYIGGVPDFNSIHRQSGFEQGFVGCISRLIISGVPQQLLRDAQVTSGVTSCETCAVNPCLNSGLCQEAHTPTGHVCICPPGFSGDTCEKIGESCYPGVCGTGRCINRPEGGFDCYCPFRKAGLRCENDIIIHEPAFQDDSFIAYPTPNARAQKHLKIATRFKPRDLKDGIILYCGQNPEGHGDFISLTIKDRHVELRFDTGSGPAVLQSKEELQADQWVRVVAERNLRDGTLTVNDGEEVRGKSPGFTRGLNLRLPLYVGGVDKQQITVSPVVQVTHGFDGCVSHMEVSGVEVDLINSVIDAANVKDCGGQTPCARQPCQNGGLCRELGTKPSDYECICQEGFHGSICEEEEDICKVIHPCINGVCVGTGTSYRCDCPLGFKGHNCDKVAELGDNVRFTGNGYLELPRELLPHAAVTVKEVVTIHFETTEPDGLILWHGQKPDLDGKGHDYFALALVDGYLEFSYELGSGPAVIRSPVRVDDGSKHKIVLTRLGRDGNLLLDNVFTETGETAGTLQMLNAGGNIYIGGAPGMDFMTAGRYKVGFNGCIHELEIQDTGSLDFQHTALGGVNAIACEDDDSDFSSEHLDNQIHE